MPLRPQLRWVPDETAAIANIDPYSHWLLVHGRPFLPLGRAFNHLAVVNAAEGFEALLKTDFVDVGRIEDGTTLLEQVAAKLDATGATASDPENHVFLMPLPDRSLAGLSGSILAQRGPARSVPPKHEIDPNRPLVVTGVIDDHINVFHACFASGGATRVDFAWFQDGARAAPDLSGDAPPVPFGRELTKADIDGAKGPDDARLRDFGLVDFRRQGANPLAFRASHGTHVADIAAGLRKADPPDRNWRIIAVSLPSLVTFDTSGATLGPCFLAGMQYIIRRARDLAQAYGRPVTLVINCSYGISAGPHDGQHFIERAIEALVAPIRDGSAPDISGIEVVLPAGNGNLDRGHASVAAAKAGARTELCLPWRIQPGDRTPSYLEIWMPSGAEEIEIGVRPPGGRASLTVAAAGATILCENGDVTPGRVVARVHRATVGARERIVIAVAPTECLERSLATAPHGVWEVSARARIAAGTRIEAWIQRDTSPIGARVPGRQSYFDDPAYARFASTGAVLARDPAGGSSVVRRAGTLNGIATGATPVVVAAYPADMAGIGVAAYSASGFGDGRDPTIAAVSDRSVVAGGVLAAGTLSGTRVAINGTSVAAPAVARRIARHVLEGGSELPALTDISLPDGASLTFRVGKGWLRPVEV